MSFIKKNLSAKNQNYIIIFHDEKKEKEKKSFKKNKQYYEKLKFINYDFTKNENISPLETRPKKPVNKLEF